MAGLGEKALIERASAGLSMGRAVLVRCQGDRSVLEIISVAIDEPTGLVTMIGRRGEEIHLAPGQLAEVRVMPVREAA